VIIELIRVAQSEKGTFGVIVKEGIPICVTCEDPWNDNKTGISCIPEGAYSVMPHSGPKYKDVWILREVPGREAILIHNGNSIADTRGCILVGKSFSWASISNSRETLDYLRGVLPGNFSLHIKNAFRKEKSNGMASK
jgi:hypothetical protein